MIAKIINTPVNFSSPFQYNEAKIASGKGELLEKNFIGGSVSTFSNTISLNKHVRNQNSNFLHISISPNDQDKLNKEELKDVAKEYLRKMGIDDNRPLLIYYHNDTAYPHLHLLTTKIDYNGKKINDSFLKYRSRLISREIEKDFNLTPTIENTREEKNTLSEIQGKKHNSDFKPLKNKVKKAIRQFVYFSDNLKELEEKLQNNGFYVRKISNGKGLSYVFGVGEKYFKDSQLGQMFTLSNLQQRIEGKLTFTPDEQKKYLLQNINRVLNKSNNFKQFRKDLNERGIDIKLSENKSGVYGIKFSQRGLDNPVEFKGSDISRELSYSKIINKLEQNANTKIDNNIKAPVSDKIEGKYNNPIINDNFFTPTHLQKENNEEELPWRKKRKKKSI